MARIFLSHSSANDGEALALRDWLNAEGWDDLFLDFDPTRGIAAGERWELALNEAANRCEAVLFLVSRAWLSSRWCMKELGLAAKLNKRIFGILIEDIPLAELPDELTATHQLVNLAAGSDHVMLRGNDLGGEVRVTFSRSGLANLKTGLMRAGLDARFFPWPPEDDQERSPYRGLRPLEAEDAGIFFGREAPTIEALDRLRGIAEGAAPRLMAILGASGAGKSSFLRAGLAPRLMRDDRTFLMLPIVRPERMALYGDAGLVRCLEDAAKAQDLGKNRADVRAGVMAGTGAVAALLSELATKAAVPDLDHGGSPHRPRVVLAIDQSEELFLSEGAQEAIPFLSLVRDLVTAEGSNLIVLFTIRSDSFEELQMAPALDGLSLQTFNLPLMPRGAYQTVIEGPAKRLADTDRVLTVEPALTAALLAEIEAGGGKDALPLLAFTLQRLYEEYGTGGRATLTLAQYRQLGGIRGSIEAAVEGALRAADSDPAVPKDRDARLALLRRGLIPWLAGIDTETNALRRRVARLSEIPQEARPLVNHLIEARLLSTDRARDTGERTVEPAHEALLRQWGLLQGWLEEDFAALSTLGGIQRAARDWAANNKDEAWLVHVAGRLEDAEEVARRNDLADMLEPTDRAYLAAAHAADTARRDRELEEARRLAETQRKVARRTRTGLIAASILALLAVGAATLAAQQTVMANKSLQETEGARAETERQLAQAQVNQSRFLAAAGQRAIDDGNPELALGLALAALPEKPDKPKSDRPFVAEAETTLFRARQFDRELAVLAGHRDAVELAVFSPDGTRVVTASSDKTARIWDAATGAELTVLRGHDNRVSSAAFSPDGTRVVTASSDKTARIWDAATGAELTVLRGHDNRVSSAAFSPDGTRVVTASYDKTARIWDAATGAEQFVLRGHDNRVSSAAFSPDGTQVVTASYDKTARVWDAVTGAEQFMLRGHDDSVLLAAFSPDGTRVVTASADKTARIWDAATGAWLKGHDDSVLSATFSPDGKRVVTASADKTARIWDAATGAELAVLKGHDNRVSSAAFSPDGTRVVTASADHTARIWDAATGAQLALLGGHDDSVSSAAFSPDGTRVVTASDDETARIWDAATAGAALTVLKGHDWVSSATFSLDGKHVVTASYDKTARIWDAATGAQLAVLGGHGDSVWSAAFSPDGTRVVTASADHTARIWDAATGAQLAVLGGHDDSVSSAAFSPDGTRVVTASYDKTARIWDAATGAELTVLRGHDNRVSSAAFSPDGTRVVTASSDKTARIWDAATGAELTVLRGHDNRVSSAAFSPDGTRVVTASYDKTARIWDAATGAELTVLRGHDNRVSSAAFSPDGTRVVTASADNTARIWDAVTGAQLAVLRGHDDSIWSAAFSPDGTRVVTASQTGKEAFNVFSSDVTVRSWDVWKYYPIDGIYAARAEQLRDLTDIERATYGIEKTRPDEPSLLQTEVTDCDRLAANPLDPARLASGVWFDAITPEAVAACESAVAEAPNNPRLHFELGRALEKAQQYSGAITAYEQAAQLGYAFALNNLGSLYANGTGVGRDPAKAVDLWSRALDAGAFVAGSALGLAFWGGDGVQENRARAMTIWQSAAAMGDPFSQVELAWVAELGRDGSAADPTDALYHYAVASRLFEQAGRHPTFELVRRGTLARLLPRAVVADAWRRSLDFKPVGNRSTK